MALAHYGDRGSNEMTVGINIRKPSDVHEVLDFLHTLVMDNIGDESPILNDLSTAMDAIMTRHGDEEDWET